ncbi:MAG: hypothetical protein FWH04_04565 [Oscillospiraceae bacterium]|nr:hypothetical protein [Oscillospiraceae bacterium]
MKSKESIIHDLIKIYSDISITSSIQGNLGKLKTKTRDIMKRKDKLLDLNLKGKLTDDEFEVRNNAFNDEMESIQHQIGDYEQQQQQTKDFADQAEILHKVISEELSFDTALSMGIVNRLLDRIEVYKTDEKNQVKLKVFLRLLEDSLEYQINRRKGKSPVITDESLTVLCNTQHSLCVANSKYAYFVEAFTCF